ncbi:MAG: nitroreductase family protein [Spirochaetes bacterium]|nr:nitroreductase family protein [Spirochaetota bacterium]
MDVQEAIQKRRAYRALGPVEITDDIIREMATAAQLMPSCFNNQPWRFVFARSKEALAKMHGCMNKGNEWTFKASAIVAAFAKRENDCLIKEREFYLFDLGQAVSAMVLRATELGLVAHPIAGFDPGKVRQALGIPDEYMVLTLVIVGKKSDDTSSLTEWQLGQEPQRPPRLPLDTICAVDAFNEKMNAKVER